MKKYFSLVKFSHTVFALPFALIGFSLAIVYEQQTFHWYLLLMMLLCMVTARNAAMAFNRYLDRKIDAENPRTLQRDIPAGRISANQALVFTIVNCVLFIVVTWFINRICFYLSPVALFVILFYSYTKRFTALCHIVLGVGLSLAPIGAYLSVTGYFSILPLLFSFAVLCWVAGFDIIYALQDDDFDKGQKLHSIPAALGRKQALWVSNGLHLLCFLFVLAAGLLGEFSIIYWIGFGLFSLLLIYQHTLVKPNDLSKVTMAFANLNGAGSIIFATFTIISLFF